MEYFSSLRNESFDQAEYDDCEIDRRYYEYVGTSFGCWNVIFDLC